MADLTDIRKALENMEDSIILLVIERSIWKRNHDQHTYTSFFNHLFENLEKTYALHGRYECPEEHMFFTTTEKIIPTFHKLKYEYDSHQILEPNHKQVNINETIKQHYLHDFLDTITETGIDEHRGTAVSADIQLLQTISRRIHFGKMVAEAKKTQLLKDHPDFHQHPTKQRLDWITYPKKEAEILNRIKSKTDHYLSIRSTSSLQSETVVDLFRNMIIPLTKQVQLQYLQHLDTSTHDTSTHDTSG